MGEPTLQQLSNAQALLEEKMNSYLAQQESAFDRMLANQSRRDAGPGRDPGRAERDLGRAEGGHGETRRGPGRDLGRAEGGHGEARRGKQSGVGTTRCRI